ncbi:MAG: hypothetical protein ACR2N3_04245 [Pyrinomonadaceae bacterium]
MNTDDAKNELIFHLEKAREWLLINGAEKSFALTNDEIELAFERGKILLSFPSDRGFQTWRVTNYKFEKQKIHLNLSRNFGVEKAKIELAPRVSADEFSETTELARIEKTNKIARLIIENQPRAKLVRVSLKKENGRLAQIIFENPQGSQIAVFVDVSGTLASERILTTAILEAEKLRGRKKNPIEKIWILAERKSARNLQKLLALLKQNWQASVQIIEFSEKENKNPQPLSHLTISDLWRAKPSKISAVENSILSETARKIIAFAPKEIDAIFTNRGETLRFQGLPFARIRKLGDAEKAWFGVEAKRQSLNEKTFEEFLELIENLKIYRRFDTPNKRHAFYALAPEAWLESILRRNIKRLDANLILSPIYNQFRAGRDKIDLLALRKDGRLIVIELKTSADRASVFQALDYWREIEIERRTGNLQKAEIFGDAEIKREPTLVYLAAPLLAFDRDFKFLAQTVSPEIEIYRFDLNQNWREKLRVIRQEKTSAE